jgi:DNA gyrase subunit A
MRDFPDSARGFHRSPDAVDAGDPTPASPPPGGIILDLDIRHELQDSYLTYAMSTIMDRALPDVRDGLKPSQRRILVAMNDLRLRPGRKHLKCAKIAGNTSGDYHPHGEAIVYPTLVNMAQKWKMRVPLIDPQGNFGSIDGDPPAAMRYTEARMTHAAVDMLADLDLETVDFQPNYDDRLMEPTVLPARFPNLIINGGVGIAVGMATSLPPHNPTEILDSIIRLLKKPDISLQELMTDELDPSGAILRRGVKGPDFPTGGVLVGKRGILEAYATGRGKVTMRGSCHLEDAGQGRQQLVVDAIPYMLVQNNLVEQIVSAVKEDRILDVSDVRNESGREAQTRIVIEIKKGADARVVEKQLYEFTSLQDTLSIMNIALVNRQPRTLTLLEMMALYIDHRADVIRRRTNFQLREARKRAHELEGMIYAVCDIDEVIKIIRSSRTREEAINRLAERKYQIPASHPYAAKLPDRLLARLRAAEADPSSGGGISLSRHQAEIIGGMRLIQLVGLEIEKLVADYTAIVRQMEEFEAILADHARVLAIIEADCEDMKLRYTAPRLTTIEDADADVEIAELIKREDVALTISRGGYAKRVPIDTYRQQGRGGKGIRASETKDDDFVEHLFVASTHDDLLCFTNTGRVYRMKVYEIPAMSRTSRGRALVNLLDLREGERTCAYLSIKDFEQSGDYLAFVSRQGIIKRTPLKEYRNVNKGGIIAVGLKEGDELIDVVKTAGSDDLMLITALGMAIRFPEEDARLMGRGAAGVKGIELSEDDPQISAGHDEVVGVVRIPMEKDADNDPVTSPAARASGLALLTITENGYGKRTDVDEYRVQPESGKMRSQSRGGKGRTDIRITDKGGRAVAALGVVDSDDVVVISTAGQLVRIAASSISRYGRGTQGVRVVSLGEGAKVIAASPVAETLAAAEGAPADLPPGADSPQDSSSEGPTETPA